MPQLITRDSPLAGRKECVDAIGAALDRVAGGRFGVVEVSGAAGIGKTRVLRHAAELAGSAGFQVCSGHATQFEREVPFELYAEALATLETTGGNPLDLLLSGHSPDRVRGYAGVRRTLAEQAGGGLVLVLDDLHWADPASLELTEYLIRQPPPGPVLMVVAFRSYRPPVRIVDAITRADLGVWRLRLEALTRQDVQVLVPDVSGRRLDLLMRASRGNPLYVRALARLADPALSELVGEHGDPDTDCTDEQTREILRALAVDLAVLDEATRRVAHAIAIVGDHAAVDLVAYVAQLPVSTVVDAMDRLCGNGLGDLDGAWFRFHHPLIRAAAHDLAGPAWRVQAHARAAGYLRAHDGPPLLLAHHVERSAQYGDEAAAATLLDAGESVAYRAPGTAVRWLGKALRILAPTSRLLAQRPAIVLLYARALGLSGELDRSWEVLQELLRDDHPRRAEAAAFGLVIARLRGDLDTAAALLHTESARAQNQPMAGGKLQVQLAALASLRENPDDVLRHARRALHLLGGRRPALGAAAQALRAWGALCDGQAAAAHGYALQAARLVDTVSDVTLYPHVELLGPLAWVETRLGDIESATRHLARAYAVIDQAGHSSALPYLLVVDAALQARLGRPQEALHLTEQAALAADRMGSLEMRAMADAVRLQPLLWTAGPAAVIALARRLDSSGHPKSRTWWRVARLNLAVAHIATEDPAPGIELLTDPSVPWPADPLTAVSRQAALAQGLAHAGDIAPATRATEEAQRLAEAAGLDHELGLAWYARAFVTARAGRPDQAGAMAQRAAARFAATGAVIEQARAHHLAGVSYTHAGQPERGHAEFGRAKAGYAACGALWLLSMITRDQRRCAARLPRRRAAATDAGTLTSRERQIADLVVTGLTNQQIADELVLSRRTVESHLSRIFPKLDVRSRTALARRLRG